MAINIDEKSLEKALKDKAVSKDNAENKGLSKEEEIGYHKGSLNTLAAERNELVKIIGNVEMIMSMHLKRLEELGVKIDRQESKK